MRLYKNQDFVREMADLVILLLVAPGDQEVHELVIEDLDSSIKFAGYEVSQITDTTSIERVETIKQNLAYYQDLKDEIINRTEWKERGKKHD